MPSKTSRKRRPRKQKTNYTKIVAIIAVLAVVAVAVSYVIMNNNDNPIPEEVEEELTEMKVLLETSLGNITIQLRDDMPITTANFKNLVHDGIYDDTIFHRVVNLPQNLVMIQGGDPTGTGIGDPSIPNIQDEFSDKADHNKNENGTIAMANKGVNYPNSGSSQFFINCDYNSHLDNLHPVFGDVIDGMDVALEILNVETDGDNKPIEPVMLIKATLID